MKKALLDYTDDVQRITCTISHEPIFDMPYNIDGYKEPVELENYLHYISDSDEQGFVSITDSSKDISAQDIVPNHELYALVNKIHLAIVNTIDNKDMASLTRFLEETSYSITSIIRINNKATMILSYVVSKNIKSLSEL